MEWASRVGYNRKESPVINRYLLNREAFLAEGRSLVFNAYNEEWLEFIIASRQGRSEAGNYDYIEGGVANDRVVDTVNLYTAGLMDKHTALKRLAEHQPNNQICLLNQALTDKYLVFDGTEKP